MPSLKVTPMLEKGNIAFIRISMEAVKRLTSGHFGPDS